MRMQQKEHASLKVGFPVVHGLSFIRPSRVSATCPHLRRAEHSYLGFFQQMTEQQVRCRVQTTVWP